MYGVEVLSAAVPDLWGYWVERRARAMGTDCVVLIGDGDSGLESWAIDELGRCEQCWSRFRPDSDLSVLNAAEGRPVAVSALLLLALTRANELWLETAGAFDPTVIDALERIGYDRSFTDVDPEAIAWDGTAAPSPGLHDAHIDAQDDVVQLPAGVRLDLGGVGKGLAADLVAQGLVDRGAASACVSLGGDVRVAGTPPEGGWRIPVEHPVTGLPAFTWPLTDGAIVQSNTRYRRWQVSGRPVHHLIDPATGQPATRGVEGVVVAGAEAWRAEGYAKAALVRGAVLGRLILERAGLVGWIFTAGMGATPSDEEVAS